MCALHTVQYSLGDLISKIALQNFVAGNKRRTRMRQFSKFESILGVLKALGVIGCSDVDCVLLENDHGSCKLACVLILATLRVRDGWQDLYVSESQ